MSNDMNIQETSDLWINPKRDYFISLTFIIKCLFKFTTVTVLYD